MINEPGNGKRLRSLVRVMLMSNCNISFFLFPFLFLLLFSKPYLEVEMESVRKGLIFYP